MSRYEIKKIREERRDTQYIILTQMQNMVMKDMDLRDPSITFGNSKFVTPKWESYFYKDLASKSSKAGYENGLPYHYIVEYYNDDFYIMMGNPEYSYSFFIEDLVKANIIPLVYKYSIVIE